jgi:hypothetical protein
MEVTIKETSSCEPEAVVPRLELTFLRRVPGLGNVELRAQDVVQASVPFRATLLLVLREGEACGASSIRNIRLPPDKVLSEREAAHVVRKEVEEVQAQLGLPVFVRLHVSLLPYTEVLGE